jgi:hypothetical protein
MSIPIVYLQGLTVEKLKAVVAPIAKKYPSEGLAIKELARFFSLPFNGVYKRESLQHNKEDMKQPLSHYYINSSHNTYLEGNQLTGKSSANAYINALVRGCKLVEIDCWDGSDGEPEVYHGHTLTSRVKFADVIAACKEFGFSTSPYPLILTLEQHCSPAQQLRIADILTSILGDDMIRFHTPVGFMKSPAEQMNKFIIRGSVKLDKGLVASEGAAGGEL